MSPSTTCAEAALDATGSGHEPVGVAGSIPQFSAELSAQEAG
jgi:hypothetical protein